MATNLYEQQHANPHHVGRDVEITYPGVSSCITVTFYFPKWMGGPILVGGHFGKSDGISPNGDDIPVQTGTIDTMMMQIANLLPGTHTQKYTPTNYLVIGQIAAWGNVQTEREYLYKKIRQIAGVSEIDDKNRWDIGEDGFQSADITVKANGFIGVTGAKYVPDGTTRDFVDAFGLHYPIANLKLASITKRSLFAL